MSQNAFTATTIAAAVAGHASIERFAIVDTSASCAESATLDDSTNRSRRRNKPSLSCSQCTQKKTKVRGIHDIPLRLDCYTDWRPS